MRSRNGRTSPKPQACSSSSWRRNACPDPTLAFPDSPIVWRKGTEDDLCAIQYRWLELTELIDGFTDLGRRCIAYLLMGAGRDLAANLELILKRCPKTAGIAWKDIAYFAKNYKRTLRNAQAWERKLEAQHYAKEAMR